MRRDERLPVGVVGPVVRAGDAVRAVRRMEWEQVEEGVNVACFGQGTSGLLRGRRLDLVIRFAQYGIRMGGVE